MTASILRSSPKLETILVALRSPLNVWRLALEFLTPLHVLIIHIRPKESSIITGSQKNTVNLYKYHHKILTSIKRTKITKIIGHNNLPLLLPSPHLWSTSSIELHLQLASSCPSLPCLGEALWTPSLLAEYALLSALPRMSQRLDSSLPLLRNPSPACAVLLSSLLSSFSSLLLLHGLCCCCKLHRWLVALYWRRIVHESASSTIQPPAISKLLELCMRYRTVPVFRQLR